MKYFASIVFLAGVTAIDLPSKILEPEPRAVLAAGETFKFAFNGTPLGNPEYTSSVQVNLHLGPPVGLVTLGSVGYSPWSGEFTIPKGAPVGWHILSAVEQFAYSFTGFPAYTKTYNQTLYIKA